MNHEVSDGGRSAKADRRFDDDPAMNLTPDVFALAGAMTVRRLRREKNITQGRAALISDISQSYLSNVEKARHAISIQKLVAFADGIEIGHEVGLYVYADSLSAVMESRKDFYSHREHYSNYRSFYDYGCETIGRGP